MQAKYCWRCGKSLRIHSEPASIYDRQTGEKLTNTWLECTSWWCRFINGRSQEVGGD